MKEKSSSTSSGNKRPRGLKVLYVLPGFTLGGTETHLLRLIDGLKKKGYDISVCFLYERFDILERLRQRDVPIHVIGMKNIVDARGLFKLFKLLKKAKPDVVHAYLFDPSIYAPLAARFAGIKAVVTSRRNYDDWMRWHHLLLQKIANMFTDRILVNSESVKRLVNRQEGVKESKITNIYNAIEKDKFCGCPAESVKRDIKNRIGLSEDAPVVTVVAKFKKSKGHRFLLKAAEKVIKSVPEVKFILVGEGPLKHQTKQDAESMGISRNIIFTGQKSDITDILSISDVCTLSSIREGFSNALMEYMAAGKAVVVTDVGGNGEVIRDGENGILVSAGNSEALALGITELLQNKEKRERFGRATKTKVSDKTFSPECMVDSFDTVYKELLGRN